VKWKEREECELCGRWEYLSPHHVFFGTANRKISEKYGMVIRVCPDCHLNGKKAIHSCIEVDRELKQKYQIKFEEKYSRALFREIFKTNYLEVDE
jgi:ribosome-binding protein aMBF1 (putative translation factor)